MTDQAVTSPAEVAAARTRLRPLSARRLGLRARITLAFTLIAALLSILLASSTWALTRENIIDQRESSATRQAESSAATIGKRLGDGTSEQDLRTLLAPLGSDTFSLLVRNGRSIGAVKTPVPAAMRRQVESGQASRMRIEVEGSPVLLVGIPLAGRAQYYEFASLSDTQTALESLSTALFGTALLTTLAGAALGRWASGLALRPLADVSVAAEAIAGGRLDTRLGGLHDPDLGVLGTSFNHMAQVLEERMDREGRFASDVSHELRSPLMTLSASIEVLSSRRDEMPDASAQAAVDLMVADVARFKQLVEDLLEISRFDAGAARLQLSEIRPGELVSQSVAWSQSPDVPIEMDHELDSVLIRADKRRLVRVIANLLDNARRYGGGATRIELRKLPSALRIVVEDDGPGVPAEERELVFDRFSRGAGSSRRAGSEGVGLGLSLVAEHVALHKGEVWVEDRPDGEEGARFVVELPVTWEHMEEHVEEAAPVDEHVEEAVPVEEP